jgi:hypothetical protein
MTAGDLTAVDPAAIFIAWLTDHDAVTAALGGEGRISARNEPPYPHLKVVDPPGGSDRYLDWLIAPVLFLTLYGDLSGAPGKAELRRILYVILVACKQLPDQPRGVGEPVVTYVESIAGGGYLPEPTGQPAYISRLQVYAHPPRALV